MNARRRLDRWRRTRRAREKFKESVAAGWVVYVNGDRCPTFADFLDALREPVEGEAGSFGVVWKRIA